MLKDLINEVVDEYIEGINTVDDLKGHGNFLYSRTPSKNLDNIRTTGASREWIGSVGAHVYGYGLYTCTYQSTSEKMTSYGDMMVKSWIPGFEHCLIYDGARAEGYKGDLAQAVHRMTFKEQVYKFIPDRNDAEYVLRNGQNSESEKLDMILNEYGIDGIVFNDWCVWKDFKRVVPYEYSLDSGRTWKKLANDNTLKYTAQTWEPSRALGKSFKDYINPNDYRQENGYFRVRGKNGYNFVDPKRGKEPLSAIWFTVATGVNEEGVAKVGIKGDYYWYTPEDDMLYDDPDMIELGIGSTSHEMAEEMNESKIRRNVNESIDEYVENASREEVEALTLGGENQKYVFCYRLGHPDQTQSIAANSFSKEFRGTGKDNTDWLGSGTYGYINPRNTPSGNYGSVLWKYAIPKSIIANHFITPDIRKAKNFGINLTFEQQLKKFFPTEYESWKRSGKLQSILTPGHSESATIRKFLELAFKGGGGASDHYMHSHGVKGFIYDGNIDHNAILSLDDTILIPIAYKNLVGQDKSWHKVEITDELWNKTYNGYDPMAFLKGTYMDYGTPSDVMGNNRVRNGFMLVKRKSDGKYNFVKAPEGGRTFASSEWFELATDVNEEGIAVVRLNGEKYWFEPSSGDLYDDPEMIELGISADNVSPS